jgi:hypothetical protein
MKASGRAAELAVVADLGMMTSGAVFIINKTSVDRMREGRWRIGRFAQISGG